MALHSSNPKVEIPSGAPASHPGIPAAEVCARAPGVGFVLLEHTQSPHSAHSWPLWDVLVSAGAPQPQEFLSAVFSPWPSQENKPCLLSHHFLTQLCCLWVVEIPASHFGKGWVRWDWNQP